MLSNKSLEAEDTKDSKDLNKSANSGEKEKFSANLSDQETTVKSLNLSIEVLSCLNQTEKLDILKNNKEPTEAQIICEMFKRYHDKYIKKWK